MKLDDIFRYSEAASAHAKEVDSVGTLINWLSVFFFCLIIGLMIYFMIRYRRRSENEKTPHISHNLFLEIAWSVIPLAIILVFFVRGYKTFINVMHPAPFAQTEDVYVTGSMWNWKFEYDNGGSVGSIDSLKLNPLKQAKADHRATKDDPNMTEAEKAPIMAELEKKIAELEADQNVEQKSYFEIQKDQFYKDGARFVSDRVFTVPVNTPVRLVITSKDVLHSFAIPAMRVKRDAVPGQKREFLFTPTKEGIYHYTCNEMCGTDHAFMVGWMNVVSQEEYAKFKEAITPVTGTPAEMGRDFWDKNCKACHAIEPGAPKGIGPNWYGLWQSEREMTDGTKVIADHQYIEESINEPGKKVVKGYAPMPSQGAFKERDIKNLTEFIKTLTDKPSESSEEAAK